jgi:DNA (cytosine-5)-methyltransferase 1
VTYRVLSLFAGIGGFDLGLERTGGFKTVAFCEIDPFCQRVLAKHWPGVPIYDDVRTLTADRLAADRIKPNVICGGFPCQDISEAGRRAGLAGERSGLWRDYARLVGELRPRFIIVENVSELTVEHLGPVLGDLAALGYDAVWNCIPASHIGARHIRDRVWIAAFLPDAEGARIEQFWRQQLAQAGNSRRSLHLRFNEPEPPRVVNGIPYRSQRNRALGNAVVPQIPEMIGRAILAAEQDQARAA